MSAGSMKRVCLRCNETLLHGSAPVNVCGECHDEYGLTPPIPTECFNLLPLVVGVGRRWDHDLP